MAQTENNADRLIGRITDAARGEAAETLAGADAECKKIALIAENDLFDIESDMNARKKRAHDEIIERSRTNASLDARKYALAARRAVVDEAFERAAQKLEALGEQERCGLIEKLMLSEAEGGECVILAGADEKSVRGSGLIAAVNEKLAAEGKKPLVLGGVTETIAGGFILRASGYEKNCSFEAMLRDARTACESEVAAILFG